MSNLRGKPYLSIVIPSRNDDHGGNALRRLQIGLRGQLEQLEKYRIDSELILVDWNPPADKPLLKDVIKWPDRLKYCTIRVIVVPPSIHQRYEYSDKMLMLWAIATNCGIRRARGEFILPATAGVLYEDDLIAFIASRGLKKNEIYRANRCDVDSGVIKYNTLEEQLSYCRENIIRVKIHPPRKHWWTERGLPDLHTSACGDFLLLSRERWHQLRGYREEDIAGSYADGLFCFMAFAAGIKEVRLTGQKRLYHIDHGLPLISRIKRNRLPFENWLSFPFLPSWFNTKIVALYSRFLRLYGYKLKSSVLGIPTTSQADYRSMAKDMVSGKRPYICNDEDWGLGQESLEEFVVSSADWDKEY